MFLIAGPAAFVVQWSAMPCHEIRILPVLCKNILMAVMHVRSVVSMIVV